MAFYDSTNTNLQSLYITSANLDNILSNKRNHVVVEPDKTVLNALKKNREINNCEYYIFDGIISNKKNKIISTFVKIIKKYKEFERDYLNIFQKDYPLSKK